MAPIAVFYYDYYYNNITLFNNNILTIIGGSGGSVASNFGVSQQTTVCLSELPIRTLIPNSIITESYSKALITMLFFRQILFLADSPSVELNDLLFTVNSYFAINTGSAKREVYTIVQSISCYFFS